MKKILQKDNKILRKISEPILVTQIKTPKIQKILREMSEALEKEHDGVAIAAPQIGYSLRIFIVSGKVFDAKDIENPESEIVKNKKAKGKDVVFINPEITKLSREKEAVPEGCLSVRPIYGTTIRAKKATVTAYDENGKKFTKGASGLLSQIFQHETEHLDGILFIDHAKDLQEETI